MEVLRGRDGRDGRDGEKGEVGSPGAQGERGWQVHVGQLGRRVCMETQVCEEVKERQDCRVHQQEEQSTLAGAVPPALLTRELHSSTLAELERHAMTTKEEEQIISVCQMIQTISSTRVECRATVILVV